MIATDETWHDFSMCCTHCQVTSTQLSGNNGTMNMKICHCETLFPEETITCSILHCPRLAGKTKLINAISNGDFVGL